MSCICCENVVALGCAYHCAPTTPLVAKMTGNHVVQFSFLDSLFYFTIAAEIGDPFVFPAVMNEDSCITFHITQPDDSLFEMTNAELTALGISTSLTGPFTCFFMDIVVRRSLNAADVSIATVACVMKLTPVEQRFDSASGTSVTVTNFALADSVRLDVFLDGRIVSNVAGDDDTIGYSISTQDIVFSEDVTGSEVVVKAFIEEEYIC